MSLVLRWRKSFALWFLGLLWALWVITSVALAGGFATELPQATTISGGMVMSDCQSVPVNDSRAAHAAFCGMVCPGCVVTQAIADVSPVSRIGGASHLVIPALLLVGISQAPDLGPPRVGDIV